MVFWKASYMKITPTSNYSRLQSILLLVHFSFCWTLTPSCYICDIGTYVSAVMGRHSYQLMIYESIFGIWKLAIKALILLIWSLWTWRISLVELIILTSNYLPKNISGVNFVAQFVAPLKVFACNYFYWYICIPVNSAKSFSLESIKSHVDWGLSVDGKIVCLPSWRISFSTRFEDMLWKQTHHSSVCYLWQRCRILMSYMNLLICLICNVMQRW